MRAIQKSFGLFLRQIADDGMLCMVLAAPLLAGSAFRFGVPALETLLCKTFGEASVLADYYLLFDLFLVVMTPYLFCFVSSMVMLSEYDDNTAAYLAVTPLGRRGYIVSRLVLPALLAAVVTVPVMKFFALASWSVGGLLLAGLLGGALSVPVCLLVVAFSHNRVEGMALAKIAGVILLGLPVPFFLKGGAQYLFSPLPSFWIAKVFTGGGVFPLAVSLAASALWTLTLYRAFARKFT